MPTRGPSGKPTTRRYSDEDKALAIRLVRQLRKELGTEHGTVKRVADQLGFGVETVRSWMKEADVDAGDKPGTTSVDAARIKELEQEVKDLRRANDILQKAAVFFGAELDRPQR